MYGSRPLACLARITPTTHTDPLSGDLGDRAAIGRVKGEANSERIAAIPTVFARLSQTDGQVRPA